ncbi:conserved hypothetical protein [Candidatus Desulfarcum epimagneticum]|uniref:CBS domain-containing protein n=1 Tax=uncultured Desulfobacteraceae bacterium TaxID=218296 RepID=A0A484HM02_9BACT|nr:conserved hypothetical protein [uncultured Desulfobacteraceae bacterium]
MKSTGIKEIIIPLSKYATVDEDAYLYEAVAELEMTREKSKLNLYPHSSVIVLRNNEEAIGILTYLDTFKALEPKYMEMGDISSLSRFGLSHKYLKSMLEAHNLFEKPLDDICRKASELKVKNFMRSPEEAEFVDENATLNEVVHQFVVGNYPSLLVTDGEKIIGALKLSDVFHEISVRIKECRI